ncbi:MAG: rRNA maturation RNase YbeY [Cyanobacteria bacterium SBLK]|nr:rRNA maturation RNase YbeY [Cyanobacteria bacterium SBLK]
MSQYPTQTHPQPRPIPNPSKEERATEEINTQQTLLAFQDCFFPRPSFPESPISEETWQKWLYIWGEAMSGEMPKGESWEVGLRLSSDREIQDLNARYRQKDFPTDVLAFAALEVNFPQAELEGEPLYLGDIVISVETAAHQAIQQGHSLKIELAWLAAHGFLHLLGWDHPDEEHLRKMLDRQRILLKMTGLFESDG